MKKIKCRRCDNIIEMDESKENDREQLEKIKEGKGKLYCGVCALKMINSGEF